MVRIQPELIPQTETKILAMTFLDGIRKFYSNPKNVEDFREWQKQRHAEKLLMSN